mmetsp:Transcript_4138/g.9187  ORF Transcript_4138/g.9187 Transcript_4138/m.9187 type:complete len:245 (-) Transcript_4138:2018-2752(-)
MGETDLNELIITFTSTLLVSNKRQRWVQTLAERTKDLRLVEHVVGQEGLGILVQLDVNLTKSVVCARFSAASCNTSLKPGLEHTETVPCLCSLNHFFHRTGSTHRHEDAFGEVLVGTKIKKLSNHLWSFRGRNLCHINLNILKETVEVQVLREFINKVESIANVNERPGIRKLCILEISLHFIRVVNVGITANTLCLLKLTKHARTLDVFEVHNRVLRKVDNCAKVVVKTFHGFGILKHLDKLF